MRILLTALLLLPLTACGNDETGEAATTLDVLAASSLTDVFEEVAAEFEADHPGVDVVLTFGSSTDLAEQAVDGAPGDVLATADEASMMVAAEGGAVSGFGPFATNVLVIVTPPDNPAGIASLDDLAGATWVRCADEAPCGKVALGVLDAQGISAEPASLEEDARSTLDKVVSGEADAALVYASDAVAAGDRVATIEIPGAGDLATTYFVGALDQTQEYQLATEFTVAVIAAEDTLTRAGFGIPAP